MTKDKKSLLITLSAGAISAGIDRILARLPKSSRPSKQAVLNDFSSAVIPGKNWGGLLEYAERSAQRASIPLEKVRDLIPVSPQGDITSHGHILPLRAEDDWLTEGEGFNDILSIFQEGSHGTPILGTLVRFHETIGGYYVDLWVSLFRLRDGKVTLEDVTPDTLDIDQSHALFRHLSAFDTLSPGEYADMTGKRQFSILSGPCQALALVEAGDIEALSKGDDKNVLEDVYFIADQDNTGEVYVMKALIEAASWSMSGPNGRHHRVDVDLPRQASWRPGPQHTNIDPQGVEKGLHRRKGTQNWLSEADVDEAYPFLATHRLGEALDFALSYHRIDHLEDAAVVGTWHKKSDRKDPLKVDPALHLLCKPRGKKLFCDLELTDPNEYSRLVHKMLEWLKAEGITVEDLSSTKRKYETIAPRVTRKNPNHWERARTLFAQLD